MFKTLIVDDNETIRGMLHQALATRFPSMMVVEAGNADSAMKHLDSMQPDLVLMDVKLPDGNGISLTRIIKANYPGIILIIITAYDLPEYRYAAVKAGADHFIPKGSLVKDDILSVVELIVKAKTGQ